MNAGKVGEADSPQTGRAPGPARSGAASPQPGQRDARDGGARPGGSAGPSGLVREGAEATSAGSEQLDALFARKCKELKGFVKPLTAILNGLKNGRYGKGLSGLQQNVAIDRIQRIVGVLENPGMGGKYLATLQQVEMMLKAWFPTVKPQFSSTAERPQNGRPASDSGSPSHYQLHGDVTNPHLKLTIANRGQTLASDAALAFGTAEDPQQGYGQDNTIAPKGMPPTSLTWTHVAPIACPALGGNASRPMSAGGTAHSATGSHALPECGVQYRRCCSLPASPSHAGASPGSADASVPFDHLAVAERSRPGRKGTRSPSSKAHDLASPINLCAERGLAVAAADNNAATGRDAAGPRSPLHLSQRRKLGASQTRRAPAPSDWASLSSCYRTAAEEEVGPSGLVVNERAGGRHGSVNRKRGSAESATPGTPAVPQHKMARQKREFASYPHGRGHNI